MTKEKKYKAWKRIECVIKASGLTARSLAKLLGVNSQNLYQIKAGNNGISLDLARQINDHFPDYSVSWLLFEEPNTHCQLPLYDSLDPRQFLLQVPSNKFFYIAKEIQCGAQFAVEYKTNAPETPVNLRRQILLLRVADVQTIQDENMYFFTSKDINGLYTVVSGCNSRNIKLRRALAPQHETLYIAKNEVLSAYHVCGIIYSDKIQVQMSNKSEQQTVLEV